MMLLALIKKEIIGHILTLRFAVTFALTVFLVFISIYITVADYQARTKHFGVMQRESQERIEETFANAKIRDRAWERRLVFIHGKLDPLPPPPLSALVQGLTTVQPIGLHTNRQEWRNISNRATQSPLANLYHRPDFVYVVSVVMSLLAILFVFDSICGEKQSGTLRLILANAVPRHSVLLSKWIGGFVVLALPFTIIFVGGICYAYAAGALVMSSNTLIRILLLLFVALLYISVFFNLSTFVSTCTHRASTSLFICLFIWVGWILVVPNLAPVAAKILSPAPSVQKIKEQKSAKKEEVRLRKSRLVLVSGELSYGSKIKREEEKLERELDDALRRWERYYENSVRRQTQLAEGLGRISPSASWVYAASALAQTGPLAHRLMHQSRSQLREAMEDKDRELLKIAEANHWKYPMVDIAEIPVLRVAVPTLEQSVEACLNDVLILSIFNVIFFMASFMAFLRYDAR